MVEVVVTWQGDGHGCSQRILQGHQTLMVPTSYNDHTRRQTINKQAEVENKEQGTGRKKEKD